jgi:hypothetical protein
MAVRHTSARKPVPYASAAESLTFKHNRNKQPEVINARLSNEIGCDCQPYHDILTIGRWRALGALVRKGEHAVAHGGKNKTIPLFCHCQIEFQTPELPETDCSGGIPGFEMLADATTEPEPEPTGKPPEGFTFGGWINDPTPEAPAPEPIPEPAADDEDIDTWAEAYNERIMQQHDEREREAGEYYAQVRMDTIRNAAVELLEACRNAELYLECQQSEIFDNDVRRRHLAQLRAAINAALGIAPMALDLDR